MHNARIIYIYALFMVSAIGRLINGRPHATPLGPEK